MKFNFLKSLFWKEHKEFDNNVKSSNAVGANINIENNDNLIKIEIKEDCTLQEYCTKIDSLLQSNSENMDKTSIDMIDRLPMRMLISNGIKTIKRQTIYLISNNNLQHTISVNVDNIYLSESKVENEEIKEGTIRICLANREYQISKYIHDSNRSTKSVKFYKPSNASNQFFCMDRQEATTVVESMIEHLEQIEAIKNILNLDDIHSYLNLTEREEFPKAEVDIKVVNENKVKQSEER